MYESFKNLFTLFTDSGNIAFYKVIGGDHVVVKTFCLYIDIAEVLHRAFNSRYQSSIFERDLTRCIFFPSAPPQLRTVFGQELILVDYSKVCRSDP